MATGSKVLSLGAALLQDYERERERNPELLQNCIRVLLVH